ncbi:caspase family protein [Pyxidicoccus parkwayensis]|uniref:Caspase family protein n=1 Tax=Pyxidicoccus parkwayensis TaxID=2813578 RepID=A0ABX7NNN7_9BACT|nr:caspase family protein [Pyxidicoccus parkwaysis]QSQ20471.1 caspase family protein [Pyxidicoccus parkwaysis]
MMRRTTGQGWGRVAGFVAAVWLVLCLAPEALAGGQGPAAPVEEPAPMLRRFALVVGSSEGGAGRERLRYAGSDALAMSRVLEELGGVAAADRVLLLEADRAALVSALERMRALVQESEAPGVRRELVLYYSGHSDGEGLLPRGERFPYEELKRALGAVPADVRIAILDSCGSGALTRYKGGVRRPAFLTDASAQVRGHAYLASSSADEVAQESDSIGASFFTHFLVTGLRGAADASGDGRVTLHEAYQFAFHETLARTERSQGGPQHAAYDIQLAGSGDLVMTDLRGSSVRLAVAEDVQGRLFVRDWGNQLVAELQKPAGRRLALGLAAGRYTFVLERPTQRFEAELTVSPKGGAELRSENFVPVSLTRTASRGGEPVAEVADVPGPAVDVPTVPLNLSLVPPLSSTALWGGSGLNHVALGVLAVRSLQLRGMGVAGGVGWVDGTMEGFQVSGVANVAGGEVFGLQVAPGGNLAFAGGTGGQLSAVFNIAEGDYTGLQLTSTANRATAMMRGAQVSAGINLTERLAGAQVGLINLSGDVSGAQVGLINVATNVRGVQLGLINISDDVSVPIGLLSIVRKGRLAFEVSADDVLPLSVSLKYGSRTVYVLATEGLWLEDRTVKTHTLIGLGVHLPLGASERYYLDTDVAVGFLGGPDGSLMRLRTMVGWELKRRFALFAGVTINTYSPPSEGEAPKVTWLPQWKLGRGEDAMRIWPGLLLGVRI